MGTIRGIKVTITIIIIILDKVEVLEMATIDKATMDTMTNMELETEPISIRMLTTIQQVLAAVNPTPKVNQTHH